MTAFCCLALNGGARRLGKRGGFREGLRCTKYRGATICYNGIGEPLWDGELCMGIMDGWEDLLGRVALWRCRAAEPNATDGELRATWECSEERTGCISECLDDAECSEDFCMQFCISISSVVRGWCFRGAKGAKGAGQTVIRHVTIRSWFAQKVSEGLPDGLPLCF